MKPARIRLFIKPSCPWCQEAEEWLGRRGIAYERLDVVSNPSAGQEMHRLTGQTRAPSIDIDGHVLADFDTRQLETFLDEHGYDH